VATAPTSPQRTICTKKWRVVVARSERMVTSFGTSDHRRRDDRTIEWLDTPHSPPTPKLPQAASDGQPVSQMGRRPPSEDWSLAHSFVGAPSVDRRDLVGDRRSAPSGGSPLAIFLLEYRGVRNPRNLPQLTQKEIIRWAKSHFRPTGNWPNRNAGPVHGVRGLRWSMVDSALKRGNRGLLGGTSLARLFRDRAKHPQLVRQILASQHFSGNSYNCRVVYAGSMDHGIQHNRCLCLVLQRIGRSRKLGGPLQRRRSTSWFSRTDSQSRHSSARWTIFSRASVNKRIEFP